VAVVAGFRRGGGAGQRAGTVFDVSIDAAGRRGSDNGWRLVGACIARAGIRDGWQLVDKASWCAILMAHALL
jgi:hypothetical protein